MNEDKSEDQNVAFQEPWTSAQASAHACQPMVSDSLTWIFHECQTNRTVRVNMQQSNKKRQGETDSEHQQPTKKRRNLQHSFNFIPLLSQVLKVQNLLKKHSKLQFQKGTHEHYQALYHYLNPFG